jgi:hypothetical protein
MAPIGLPSPLAAVPFYSLDLGGTAWTEDDSDLPLQLASITPAPDVVVTTDEGRTGKAYRKREIGPGW